MRVPRRVASPRARSRAPHVRSPLRRRAGVVDGGAHERVPELQAPVGDAQQSAVLGRLQCRAVQSPGGESGHDGLDLAGGADCRDQQRLPRARRQATRRAARRHVRRRSPRGVDLPARPCPRAAPGKGGWGARAAPEGCRPSSSRAGRRRRRATSTWRFRSRLVAACRGSPPNRMDSSPGGFECLALRLRGPRRRRRRGRPRAAASRTGARPATSASSQWASSTRTSSGLASAAAASRLSVAAPTEKRSCSSAAGEAECGAQRVGLTLRDLGQPVANGQQTSSSPENSSSASDSTPTARTTFIASARSAA